MNDLEKTLIEIQDFLIPILDTYEQAIYRYIFRHTYLIGEKQMLFSTKSAPIGLGSGKQNTPPSESQRSKKIRSLELKGAVKILDRSYKGLMVSIVLPRDIVDLIPSEEEFVFDMERLDFYKDRRLMQCILDREGYRCFYTGKKINSDNCYLDHVIPQANGGDNSYKNIVASCYDANSLKTDKPVDEFIRLLYKEELLSLNEFNDLKLKIQELKNGNLVPSEASVIDAIKS